VPCHVTDRQDVPLAGLVRTGCTLVVGEYCLIVRRKISRGGNKATLPQEFSKPLPLAGVSFYLRSAGKKLNLTSSARFLIELGCRGKSPPQSRYQENPCDIWDDRVLPLVAMKVC